MKFKMVDLFPPLGVMAYNTHGDRILKSVWDIIQPVYAGVWNGSEWLESRL